MHHLIRQMRNARRNAGISQTQLARLSGMSVTSISSIENYKQSPTLEALSQLLPHIGMTLTLTPLQQE